jgi:hypothetical protein
MSEELIKLLLKRLIAEMNILAEINMVNDKFKSSQS